MHPTIKVVVDFPALDKLVEFLCGHQQEKIDALTSQVQTLTASLGASGKALDDSIQENQ